MRLVLVLLLAIFIVEFGIMAFFLVLPPSALNGWVEAVIDSSVLNAVLFPVLFLVVFRPLVRQVKELEQAEKELERARAILENALRVKSEFMNNVTHELRTPLNAVIGRAELHGGTLEVESEPGKGSTFTLRLPCRYAGLPAFG
jgi:signal transduction histidine kinase